MKKIIYTLNLAFFLQILSVPVAHADLDSMKARLPELVKAKEDGIVGEQPDGLVGIVDPAKASAEIKAIVKAENNDRLDIYKKRAEKSGQDYAVFIKVIGEARIEKEKSGRYFKKMDGSWDKK